MDLDQNLYKNLLIISFVYWEVINQNTVSGLPKIRWKKQGWYQYSQSHFLIDYFEQVSHIILILPYLI